MPKMRFFSFKAFDRNMDFLCDHFWMHCVDWLGTGLSGRPKFTPKTTRETEDFFIEALKAWHDRQGFGKTILMGHSLGGYLAALYAHRYPEDVQHLILVSPAAVVPRTFVKIPLECFSASRVANLKVTSSLRR